MEYELAKKLKGCRFPLAVVKYHANLNPDRDVIIGDSNEGEFYLPSLSELIEACGEDFRMLLLHTQFTKRLDKPWEAVPNKKRVPEIKGQKGSTPEEAVSYLWLAINEKKGE